MTLPSRPSIVAIYLWRCHTTKHCSCSVYLKKKNAIEPYSYNVAIAQYSMAIICSIAWQCNIVSKMMPSRRSSVALCLCLSVSCLCLSACLPACLSVCLCLSVYPSLSIPSLSFFCTIIPCVHCSFSQEIMSDRFRPLNHFCLCLYSLHVPVVVLAWTCMYTYIM